MDRAGRHENLRTRVDGASESPVSLSEPLRAIPPHLHHILDQLLPHLVNRAFRRQVRGRPSRQLVRLSIENLEQLGADYQSAGVTVPLLTRRYGIHRTTVLGHLEQLGIERRAHVRKLTDEQVVLAAKLYATGLSLAAVGSRLGVDVRPFGRSSARRASRSGLGSAGQHPADAIRLRHATTVRDRLRCSMKEHVGPTTHNR